MILIGVSVQWIVHAYGSCISVLDNAWFWEEYRHWIVHGSERSVSAVDSIWFWQEYHRTG